MAKINGYDLVTEFTNKDAGMSEWAFAKKGGKDYFIKRYLSPKYPIDGSPGSLETKKRKKEKCARFENHHKAIIQKLKTKIVEGEGASINSPVDFFRMDTRYFKVLPKINTSSLTIQEISKIDLKKKNIMLRFVMMGMKILDDLGIVHGDLKPANILIKEPSPGIFSATIIDLDSGYLSGKPPGREEDTDEIGGDQTYYSPELLQYVKKSSHIKSEDMTIKSDMFSLGIIIHQYLSGEFPDFNKSKYDSVATAVLDGEAIQINSSIPNYLKILIESMLNLDYTKRPNASYVFDVLKNPEIISLESEKLGSSHIEDKKDDLKSKDIKIEKGELSLKEEPISKHEDVKSSTTIKINMGKRSSVKSEPKEEGSAVKIKFGKGFGK